MTTLSAEAIAWLDKPRHYFDRRFAMLHTGTIVAAAIRIENTTSTLRPPDYPGQLIVSSPPPARHHHLLHPIATMVGRCVGPDGQGFLTSRGIYVDRKTAFKIAVKTGQVDPNNRKSGSDSGDLFSEDLW